MDQKYMIIPRTVMFDSIYLGMSPEQKLVVHKIWFSQNWCGVAKVNYIQWGFDCGMKEESFKNAFHAVLQYYSQLFMFDEQTKEVAIVKYPSIMNKDCKDSKVWKFVEKFVCEIESIPILKAIVKNNPTSITKPYLKRIRQVNIEKLNEKKREELAEKEADPENYNDLSQVIDNQEANPRSYEVGSINPPTPQGGDQFTQLDKPEDGHTKQRKPKDVSSEATEIIKHLNEAAHRDFRPTSASTQRVIRARLREGFTIEDFKTVIDFKASQWRFDHDMSQYLRPSTLFGSKFEGYLEAAKNKPVTEANTDKALNDAELPPDMQAAHSRYMAWVLNTHGSLFRSNCRVLSKSEWADVWENKSLPGAFYHVPKTMKNRLLAAIHEKLASDEFLRRKFSTVFDLYKHEASAVINNKPTLTNA